MRKTRRETRNYELDKTISHTRAMPGRIRRLSVAVVVDDRVSKDNKGGLVRTPLTPEELARITALVKEAVGFSADRGDTVHVTNASFVPAPPAEVLPEPPVWEGPWLKELIKPGLGALIVLIVLFGIIRPLLRRRASPQAVPMLEPPSGRVALPGKVSELKLAEDRVSVSLPKLPTVAGLPSPLEYEAPLQAAKVLVEQDPARALQVIRGWLAGDA